MDLLNCGFHKVNRPNLQSFSQVYLEWCTIEGDSPVEKSNNPRLLALYFIMIVSAIIMDV
jgi:hypothetical protein